MRPHGHLRVDPRNPVAAAVCDRCGQLTNRNRLQWQMGWRGPRVQNLKVLVCRGCLDKLQEQLRTIVLPADPVPISDPRPENYVSADNPLSGLGTNIGNMTLAGGLKAAFDGNPAKPIWESAMLAVSQSSYQNTVGKNWSGTIPTITPSSIAPPSQSHSVTGFTLYAPIDARFLATGATGYRLQGSNDNATWTTLYSGTTVGTVGEVITSTSTGFLSTATYPYHHVAIQGDGISQVAIGLVRLNVGETGQNDI